MAGTAPFCSLGCDRNWTPPPPLLILTRCRNAQPWDDSWNELVFMLQEEIWSCRHSNRAQGWTNAWEIKNKWKCERKGDGNIWLVVSWECKVAPPYSSGRTHRFNHSDNVGNGKSWESAPWGGSLQANQRIGPACNYRSSNCRTWNWFQFEGLKSSFESRWSSELHEICVLQPQG